MDILAKLEKRSNFFLAFVGFILIGIIGVLDYLTGYEFAFSIFYVLPISLVTWTANRQLGIAVSIASAIVWLVADITTGNSYSHPFIPVWNTLIRFAFFIIITFLLSSLKSSLQREKELARTDYLTTAVNSRHFYEIAQMEIDRFQRYQQPFTIAYVDLDDFKTVNDRFGHAAGDQVLRTLVSSVKKIIRKTDTVARLGGDEFAILFPETGQESARVAFAKIQSILGEETQQKDWTITFSVGVLTCKIAPHTTDELVRMADELMYLAKSEGRNTIKYSTYTG